MAVKNLNLPNFPTFDLGETDTISPRWKKYKQRFELLCTAVGVNEEKQKLAMFLTYVGDETFEVYENIKPNDAPTYKETIEAFDKHFMPLTNKSYETFLFRNLKQDEGENLNEFYIRLKEQAAKCGFADTDLNIKQQIELTTTSNKLRMYSFQNPEKTLQELLTTGRAYEQTSKQMEEISKKKEVKDHQSEIFYTSNKKQQNFGKNRNRQGGVSKSCYRCGGAFPHTNKSCPAEGKTCNKCQKKNHFAAVCKTKARG